MNYTNQTIDIPNKLNNTLMCKYHNKEYTYVVHTMLYGIM